MTREEITKKIESFGKRELTKDELYELGKMHRELPLAQRDWTWMAEVAGWKGNAEAYRGYVKGRMKRENTLPVATSDNAIESANQPELVKQRHEIFKERQKLRDERTNLNRTLRDEARIERFEDTIIEAIKTLDKLPEIKPIHNVVVDTKEVLPFAKSPVEAIAMLSDLHIGMEIDEYCNKYNVDIATIRVNKWVQDVIKYCKANKVQRLNIVNLGDLISGLIHTTLRIQEEFDVATQVIQASEIVARALNALQEAAPEVIYRSCTDNHSRFMPNKNEHIEKENWCRIIDWYLKERLKDTNIIFKNDNLSQSLGKFQLMNGKTVMFAHGHLDKPNASFQNFIGATEEFVHYVLLGHYHCEKVKMFQNMKVLINGSICGTDPYAESIRKYTKPAQTLLIFDDDNLINHSINLDIVSDDDYVDSQTLSFFGKVK